jgi:Domain of unknown function (DUF4145)
MEHEAIPANVIREDAPTRCPHCQVAFNADWFRFHIENDRDGHWWLRKTKCPTCSRLIATLMKVRVVSDSAGTPFSSEEVFLLHPRTSARPIPTTVPDDVAEDYREAARVLPDSPKASAALSRRLLQRLLRDHGGVTHGNLSQEIDQAIPTLPARTAEALDAIRAIGNFAAHALKSANSGEIIDVEPGEAEWSLDVLDLLFDFYFTAPAVLKAKLEAINAKLADAGKPPLKLAE